jgi:hypothetical protein
MTSFAKTMPARPVQQTLFSAFGAALFGWALPVAMIATLFQG